MVCSVYFSYCWFEFLLYLCNGFDETVIYDILIIRSFPFCYHRFLLPPAVWHIVFVVPVVL